MLTAIVAATDVTAVAASTSIALVGRRDLPFFAAADVHEYVPTASLLLVAGWPIVIWLLGGYRSSFFGAGTDEFRLVINASVVVAALTGIACFLARFPLSRGYFVLLFVVGTPLLVAGRWILRRGIHRLRARGHLQNRLLIAGTPEHVDELATVLARESWLGYDVVGALVPARDGRESTPAGIPVVGQPEHTAAVLERHPADTILIASGAFRSSTQMRQVAWDLEQRRVSLVMAPSMTDVARERISVRPVAGLPLVHVDTARAVEASRWAKRAFDIAGSLALIVALAPLLAVTWLVVRIHDGGPALYHQRRVGRDGVEFGFLKFRSMVIDADQMVDQLRSEQGVHGVLFKLARDPRVTAPGRFLRRFSIDEMPQLFNVLRGDMSLVGPRPPLPSEVAAYEDDMRRRLRVRPGLTGLWQVSGRSDLSWEDTVRLDLYYVDNWSMTQDLTILFRTISAVFRGRGAY